MDNQPTGATQNQNNSLGGLLQGYPAKAACPHCGYCPHCGRSNPNYGNYGYPGTLPGYYPTNPTITCQQPGSLGRVGSLNHY